MKITNQAPKDKDLDTILKTFGPYAKGREKLIRTGESKDDDGIFIATEIAREDGISYGNVLVR